MQRAANRKRRRNESDLYKTRGRRGGKGSLPVVRIHRHPAERKYYQRHPRRRCICRPLPSRSVAAARVLASSRIDFGFAAASVACRAETTSLRWRTPRELSTRGYAALLDLTLCVLSRSSLAVAELRTRSHSREMKIERAPESLPAKTRS